MKKWIYTLAGITLLPLWSGCEKELMDYEGKDGIYFDVQYPGTGQYWGDLSQYSHQIYSIIPFGNMDGNDSLLNLKVGLAGSVKDYPRSFKVEVVADSTSAISPDEFELMATDIVMEAGKNTAYVPVIVRKSERMDTNTIQIQIRLIAGEELGLLFSRIGNIPGRWTNDTQTYFSQNEDPNIHNIFANNILREPSGWNKVQLGDFSPTKYAMLLNTSYEAMGFVKSDFEDRNKMQGGRCRMIARIGSKYLMEQYRKGREYWVIDEDGTMMWVNGVSWANHTKPEDMVN